MLGLVGVDCSCLWCLCGGNTVHLLSRMLHCLWHNVNMVSECVTENVFFQYRSCVGPMLEYFSQHVYWAVVLKTVFICIMKLSAYASAFSAPFTCPLRLLSPSLSSFQTVLQWHAQAVSLHGCRV